MKRPSVVVVTRRTARKGKYIDYVSEAHLEALIALKLRPVMVPVVEGTLACLPERGFRCRHGRSKMSRRRFCALRRINASPLLRLALCATRRGLRP